MRFARRSAVSAGALSGIRPDDLAAHVLSAVVSTAPGLEPGAVDEVVFGNANGAGEDNRNVARMAVLLAGLPVTVPATTVNRLCGSSLDAAHDRLPHRSRPATPTWWWPAGVESMTRAPWVLPKPSGRSRPGT